ncbi:MAG: FAD:protein FMN transferase [Phycisphaerae bacterium]|nr:FAD:protein FMN transferase [Phycisphaerae bacterium]
MKIRNLKQTMILVAAFAIFLSLLILFPNPPVTYDTGKIVRLGTYLQIRVYCKNQQVARSVVIQAMEVIDQMEDVLSTYRPDSQLSQANQKAGSGSVPVSSETFELLKRGLEYHHLTDGALDMTVQPLIDLWKQAETKGALPSSQEIINAIKLTGYDKVVLTGPPTPTVSLAQGAVLNVNAFAKGYIVDKALRALQVDGVMGGLVNIGGEIACFGTWESGRPFTLGIQDPFSESNDEPFTEKPRWLVTLRNCAIATSGNYRQYVTIQGEQYSHIIDPRTGHPATILPSVTVIAPTCLDADALATAISVLGPQKGLLLIESLPSTEAFLIANPQDTAASDPKIYQSTGWRHYQTTQNEN